MKQINRPYFQHFIIETQATPENLNSLQWLKDKTENLLKQLEITTITNIHYEFKPVGISLVFILSSSHIAIHTWPENGYLHIDLVTCTKNPLINKIEIIAKSVFKENTTKVSELRY